MVVMIPDQKNPGQYKPVEYNPNPTIFKPPLIINDPKKVVPDIDRNIYRHITDDRDLVFGDQTDRSCGIPGRPACSDIIPHYDDPRVCGIPGKPDCKGLGLFPPHKSPYSRLDPTLLEPISGPVNPFSDKLGKLGKYPGYRRPYRGRPIRLGDIINENFNEPSYELPTGDNVAGTRRGKYGTKDKKRKIKITTKTKTTAKKPVKKQNRDPIFYGI
jgi:hypothetical protein